MDETITVTVDQLQAFDVSLDGPLSERRDLLRQKMDEHTAGMTVLRDDFEEGYDVMWAKPVSRLRRTVLMSAERPRS